jgi:ABC-2 type transport system ATP-binding protein
MEEAEKVADYICIIDHGKIVSQGKPAELKKKTRTKSLEDAFIKLTGRNIREQEGSALDNMRLRRRVWGRR